MLDTLEKALDMITTWRCVICSDIFAAMVAVFAVSTAWMEGLDLFFKLVISALTIFLLVLRIRAHLK